MRATTGIERTNGIKTRCETSHTKVRRGTCGKDMTPRRIGHKDKLGITGRQGHTLVHYVRRQNRGHTAQADAGRTALIAITVHEFAHGWVSYKLGDPTPKYEGRLSLNPLRHLDLIGTLCLLFFHMGWAKPVRINTAYYRNKRQGIIWVSLAGPVANFLTAFLSLLICGALMRFGNSGNSAVSIGIMLCYYSAVLNIGLGVFNLIPIPPLDGSNVVEQMYPRVFYFYQRIRPYCTLILLILLVTGVLSRPLSVANNGIFAAMWNIVSTIFSLGTGGSSGGGISSGGGYI